MVIYTVAEYLFSYLGVDLLAAGGLSSEQWMSVPAQKFRTIAGGGVFRDDIGTLAKCRAVIAGYYPRDVWIYMLHAGYSRLGQLSHFMGRCGMTGDELGSRLIASQLVHDASTHAIKSRQDMISRVVSERMMDCLLAFSGDAAVFPARTDVRPVSKVVWQRFPSA